MLPLQNEIEISTEAQIRLLKGEIKLRCRTFVSSNTYINSIDDNMSLFDGKNIIKITSTIIPGNSNLDSFKEVIRVWFYE